jgi:hypothetical protein
MWVVRCGLVNLQRHNYWDRALDGSEVFIVGRRDALRFISSSQRRMWRPAWRPGAATMMRAQPGAPVPEGLDGLESQVTAFLGPDSPLVYVTRTRPPSKPAKTARNSGNGLVGEGIIG